MNENGLLLIIATILGTIIARTIVWLKQEKRRKEALILAIIGCAIAAIFVYIFTKDILWTILFAILIFVIEGGVGLVRNKKV